VNAKVIEMLFNVPSHGGSKMGPALGRGSARRCSVIVGAAALVDHSWDPDDFRWGRR